MTLEMKNGPGSARKDRPFPWRCFKCSKKEVYPTTISYTVKARHDDALHELTIPQLTVARCGSCGETDFTNETDAQIRRALRQRLNLLAPEQIRAGRQSLRLSENELADRLGVSAEAVTGWEDDRQLQSRATDNLLRLYFGMPEVRAALKARAQDISFGTVVVDAPTAEPLRAR